MKHVVATLAPGAATQLTTTPHLRSIAGWAAMTLVFGVATVALYAQLGDGPLEAAGSLLGLLPTSVIAVVLALQTGSKLALLIGPRVVVTIAEPGARVGETAHLTWRTDGVRRPIRGMTITVEGREVAPGTTLRFRRTTVARLTGERARTGELAIAFRDDDMHSFEGGYAAIQWVLTIAVDVAMWPDVDAELVIDVGPKPIG